RERRKGKGERRGDITVRGLAVSPRVSLGGGRSGQPGGRRGRRVVALGGWRGARGAVPGEGERRGDGERQQDRGTGEGQIVRVRRVIAHADQRAAGRVAQRVGAERDA